VLGGSAEDDLTPSFLGKASTIFESALGVGK